jgi:hypothetical protein
MLGNGLAGRVARSRIVGRRCCVMAVDAALLDRAGELKRELVAFSRQSRYDRAFREVLARHGDGSEVLDEHRLMMLWDYFVLEHRLRNGRTLVEQFVDAHLSFRGRSGRCCSAGAMWCKGRSRCNAAMGRP